MYSLYTAFEYKKESFLASTVAKRLIKKGMIILRCLNWKYCVSIRKKKNSTHPTISWNVQKCLEMSGGRNGSIIRKSKATRTLPRKGCLLKPSLNKKTWEVKDHFERVTGFNNWEQSEGAPVNHIKGLTWYWAVRRIGTKETIAQRAGSVIRD